MFNILTLNKIAKCGLDQLNDNYKITDDANVDADGIILRSFKMHDMELPESLKAVARAGAGTNNIPIDKCSEKGIVQTQMLLRNWLLQVCCWHQEMLSAVSLGQIHLPAMTLTSRLKRVSQTSQAAKLRARLLV